MSSPPIESYYLETTDGLFFAVKGFEHPPDRCIGVLRYAPDPAKGDRIKAGVSYRRLYHFDEQEQWLLKHNPACLAYDPVFDARLQSVPLSAVRRIYDPILRLRELAQSSAGMGVEGDAVAFLRLVQTQSGVPWDHLGITGSLLIGMHTEYSDLDAVVFGTQSCRQVYKTLHNLLEDPSVPDLRRLDRQGMEALHAVRSEDTPMPYEEFIGLEARKVNQGSFRGRPYFIRFVKNANEAGWIYGEKKYSVLGRAEIRAVIADDRDALFTPCSYFLSEVRGLSGALPANLNEIVSFRGRFCEQAFAGESIMASGTLERVQSGQDSRHRLLLGNTSEDTFCFIH